MEVKNILQKLIAGQDLAFSEAKRLFSKIVLGQVSSAQAGAVLAALACKGESVEELKALVEIMRREVLKVKVSRKYAGSLLDTCGTGGSRIRTFNISTCTAFVLAAAGVKVAKHGNRSASGVCGSADILESLGVNIKVPSWKVKQSIEKINIGFLFAPLYHPALKNIAPVRKSLGVKTIFNLAGPLSNPAGVGFQVLGVYAPELVEKIASVLKELGVVRAFVFSSAEGVDEITLSSTLTIAEVKKNRIKKFFLKPADFGLPKIKISAISVKTLEKNKEVFTNVLCGKKSVFRNVVLANAAAGLVLMAKARNWKQGVEIASFYLDKGLAWKKFEELKRFYSE